MKNIVFYITHKTLNLEHAELTFSSFKNQKCDKSFDTLYIYNSHKDELSNDVILNLFNEYKLNTFFKEVVVFPYDETTHKSLGADVNSIKQFCKRNYNEEDRILIIKSDSILSVNFFDDVLNQLPKEGPVYFVAPFICAKKRVSNEKIIEYSKRELYVPSDDITFFVEDQYQSSENDFNNRKDVDVSSESILFTSCYVIRDFSCHFLSVSLLDSIRIQNQSWGGVWFQNLVSHFIPTKRSFVIHKYHDIVSENRQTDREGPVKDWLNS